MSSLEQFKENQDSTSSKEKKVEKKNSSNPSLNKGRFRLFKKIKKKDLSIIWKAFHWTFFTLVLSALPILMLVMSGAITLENFVYATLLKDFVDGSLLFIGVSCAGASFLDCHYSEYYETLSTSRRRWVNIIFLMIVSTVGIIYTTASILQICAVNGSIDMGNYTNFNIVMIFLSMGYSWTTKFFQLSARN